MFGISRQDATCKSRTWAFHVTEPSYGTHLQNATNHATISMSEFAGKINCSALQLLSLNIPKTQQVIEKDINDRLFIQEGGIRLPSELSSIQFSVESRSIVHTSSVPPTLNNVSVVERLGPTKLRLTTELPHSLNLLDLISTWCTIELINTCFTARPLILNTVNTSVVGLNTFDVIFEESVCDYLQTMSADEMSVWVPEYPSRTELVSVIRAGFSPAAFFEIEMTVDSNGSVHITPRNPNIHSFLSIQPSLLSDKIGFGFTITSVGTTAHLVSYEQASVAKEIILPAGDYGRDPDLLSAQIQRSLNQFYLAPGQDINVLAFNFTDSRSVQHVISMSQGNYSANGFAVSLADNLNSAESGTAEYDVFCSTNGITIRSLINDQRFAIDFTNDQYHEFAQQFGFLPTLYNGRSIYESSGLGIKNFSQTSPYIYTLTSSPTLQMHIQSAPIGNMFSISTLNSENYTIVCESQVHGLQPSDIVTMRSINAPDGVKMIVDTVVDAYEFTLFAPKFANFGQISSMERSDRAIARFVFPSTSGLKSLGSQTLGYSTRQAINTNLDRSNVFASFPMSLTPVPYVLIELVSPTGMTNFSHAWNGEIIHNLIAKVDMTSSDSSKIEPLTNALVRFYGIQGITKVELRILNPNHTLYQLHGQQWSGTIELSLI